MASRQSQKDAPAASRYEAALQGLWFKIRLPAVLALCAGVFLAASLFVTGCEDDTCISCLDRTPPAVPTGVFSVTGDGFVELFWSYLEYPNAADLVGYRVWRDDNADGAFEWLADVDISENFDDLTYRYVDTEVVNGLQYEYAVSSIDAAGNESVLSYEIVTDIPRPEGYDIELFDFATNPTLSGFDFSLLENGRVDPGTHIETDIIVEFERGVPYVRSARPDIVSLQDYGTFVDGSGSVRLDWVDWAPATGYSSSGKAELITGHAYILEIAADPENDLHYAKFAVTNVMSGSVRIDWAYQIVNGSPELKAPASPRFAAGDSDPIRF